MAIELYNNHSLTKLYSICYWMILLILNIIKLLFNNHAQVSNYVRIFLMASLIMLSASAALIGNMHLFSDAMASGKHSDKNYKYQEDEKKYYSD